MKQTLALSRPSFFSKDFLSKEAITTEKLQTTLPLLIKNTSMQSKKQNKRE